MGSGTHSIPLEQIETRGVQVPFSDRPSYAPQFLDVLYRIECLNIFRV